MTTIKTYHPPLKARLKGLLHTTSEALSFLTLIALGLSVSAIMLLEAIQVVLRILGYPLLTIR